MFIKTNAFLKTHLHFFIFISLFIFTLLMRFPSFSITSLDDDEGIYMLMGKFLLDGHLPYIHYFDHQPPLIYILSAIVQFFGIKSVLGIKILGSLFVSMASFMICLIVRLLFKNEIISYGSAVLYIIMISGVYLDGLAFNNEIIFNFFTLWSLYLLLKAFMSRSNFLKAVAISGFIFGFGFLTKQQVIYDYISFFMVFFLYHVVGERKGARNQGIIIFAISSGVLLFITSIIYLIFGKFEDFIFAIWTSNIRYIEAETINKELIRYVLIHLKHLIYLIPFIIIPLFFNLSKIKKRNKHFINSRFKVFILFWLVLTFSGTLLSKTFYPHYFIQIIPPLIIFVAMTFFCINNLEFKKRIIPLIITLFLIILSIVNNKYITKISNSEEDALFRASEYIKRNSEENDTMFVVDGDVMMYYLTDFDILTRYAFPVHLTNKKYSYAFNYDQVEEFAKVIKKKPTWLVFEKAFRFYYRKLNIFKQKEMIHFALKNYSLKKVFKNSEKNIIEVYRIN